MVDEFDLREEEEEEEAFENPEEDDNGILSGENDAAFEGTDEDYDEDESFSMYSEEDDYSLQF